MNSLECKYIKGYNNKYYIIGYYYTTIKKEK